MRIKRVYITVFTLTFIVALAPLFIGNTSGYTTQFVETVQVHITMEDSNPTKHVVDDGEAIITEAEPPAAAPNTAPVPEAFIWLLPAFALLVAVFVYMSFRRKAANAKPPAQEE